MAERPGIGWRSRQCIEAAARPANTGRGTPRAKVPGTTASAHEPCDRGAASGLWCRRHRLVTWPLFLTYIDAAGWITGSVIETDPLVGSFCERTCHPRFSGHRYLRRPDRPGCSAERG